MTLLGNIIWFIVAGFWNWLSWTIVGIGWCLTIVGVPFGIQCFKIANFAVWPFNKQLVQAQQIETGCSCLGNIIWFIAGGLELAIVHVFSGCLLYITIIGIPFARQQFKLARLAMMPFGVRVI